MKGKVGLVLTLLIVGLIVSLPLIFPNQNSVAALANDLTLAVPKGWHCDGNNTNKTSIRENADAGSSGTASVPSKNEILLKAVPLSEESTQTSIAGETWQPYVPSADQVTFIAEPENHLIHVDLTFPDSGYRIANEGYVAVAAGVRPDGTTYLSNLTTGVKIEKYTGNSLAIITTKRITYQIYYGDTTYFAFQVSGATVKDITITKTPVSPNPTLPAFSPSPTPTPTVTANTGCTVSYVIRNDWGNGATVNVTIKNNGPEAINGWALAWDFPGKQTISNLWNGRLTQNGNKVIVKNASYNAVIAPNGGTVNFGFILNYSGKNLKPSGFTLNGTACQVQ